MVAVSELDEIEEDDAIQELLRELSTSTSGALSPPVISRQSSRAIVARNVGLFWTQLVRH